jgi:hypothetical protein
MTADQQPPLKRGRGRPKLAKGEKRLRLYISIAPDVHDALYATGNASRTIDDLVKRYLIDQPPTDV